MMSQETNPVDIPLTKGLYAIVDAKVADMIGAHKWHTDNGYAVRAIKEQGAKWKTVRMHIFIWESVNGPVPEGKEIDHRNGKRADNRLSNLRVVTPRGNASNQKCHREGTCSSIHVGVSWQETRGKWQTRIYIMGKHYNLGRFTSEIEASNAYQAALRNYEERGEVPGPPLFSSQFKGVGWHKETEKWMAYIKINSRNYYLGVFDLEERASAEYQAALRNYEERGELPKTHTKSSKHKGVGWSKTSKKWAAFICISGIQYSLGYFDHEQSASDAYTAAKHAYDTNGTLPSKKGAGK